MAFAITCFLRFCFFFYLACFFCFVLFLCCRVRGLERLEKKERGRDWGETHTSLALGHSRSKTPRSFCQVVSRVGLSRLCSATFEQLLAFGATFCGFSNLEQVLPFRAIFEQNIGLEHISSTKKSTISWKTSIHANFLKAYHVINLLNT